MIYYDPTLVQGSSGHTVSLRCLVIIVAGAYLTYDGLFTFQDVKRL